MEKMRRQWIDTERKTNPTFAPDIESAKELLSPAEVAETEEYESLRHKLVALDPKSKYKPYKISEKEKKRYLELLEKYRHIYFSPA